MSRLTSVLTHKSDEQRLHFLYGTVLKCLQCTANAKSRTLRIDSVNGPISLKTGVITEQRDRSREFFPIKRDFIVVRSPAASRRTEVWEAYYGGVIFRHQIKAPAVLHLHFSELLVKTWRVGESHFDMWMTSVEALTFSFSRKSRTQ